MQFIHFVWFGSFLKTKYQNNIAKLANDNRILYRVKLWTDFDTLSVDEIDSFRFFCDQNEIELCNIRVRTELTNHALISLELEKSITDSRHKLVHFVRASDIARIAILIEFGGVYLDTDTISTSSLPTLSMPHGFLVKGDFTQESYNIESYDYILYDFMAANPQNKTLLFAAEITRLDYQTYEQSVNKLWEQSDDYNVHLYSTVRLTGSAMRWTINYQLAHGEIINQDFHDIFFDCFEYIYSTYDKSWLQECVSSPSDEVSQSLQMFRCEIEDVRNKHFPHDLPSTEKARLEFPEVKLKLPAYDSHHHFSLEDTLKRKNDISNHDIEQYMLSRVVGNFHLLTPEPISIEPLKLKPIEFKFNLQETDNLPYALQLLQEYKEKSSNNFVLFSITKTSYSSLAVVNKVIEKIKANELTFDEVILELRSASAKPNCHIADPLHRLIIELELKVSLLDICANQHNK